MPKYVQLRDDISLDMMQDFWRRTSCPNKLRHITMIQDLKKGATPKEIAQNYNYSLNWIYIIIQRFNEKGFDGLGDFRMFNGRFSAISEDVYMDIKKNSTSFVIQSVLGMSNLSSKE